MYLVIDWEERKVVGECETELDAKNKMIDYLLDSVEQSITDGYCHPNLRGIAVQQKRCDLTVVSVGEEK